MRDTIAARLEFSDAALGYAKAHFDVETIDDVTDGVLVPDSAESAAKRQALAQAIDLRDHIEEEVNDEHGSVLVLQMAQTEVNDARSAVYYQRLDDYRQARDARKRTREERDA